MSGGDIMSPEQLAQAVGCNINRATQWLPHIEAAMAAYGIDTPTRQAAFLAQIGHESGHLTYVREIWGPTPAQAKYEGRKDLGNDQPGDGFKFRGRGLIQITGRANYLKVGEALGLALDRQPEMLELPKWAALSAAWFWYAHGLNALADNAAFGAITRTINGGTNGSEERIALWEKAREALVC